MAMKRVQPPVEAEKLEMHKIQLKTEPCWKKKKANEGFLAAMKEHLNEFANTSMDQHKICLKKTIEGVSGRFKRSTSLFGSKTENDLGAKEVESSKQVHGTTTQ